MKRILLFLLVVFLFNSTVYAQFAGGASFLIKNAPSNLQHVSTAVTRQVFRNARANLKAPASLLPRLKKSIVQIAIPRPNDSPTKNNAAAYASGFLLSAYGQVWVASAYHVMGAKDRIRIVRMISKDGQEKEITVQVGVHGVSGWHEADLSLAPINPKDIPEGMEPLEIAEPDLKAPAYSVGYTMGDFTMDDVLPVRRELTSAEGINLYGTYHIEGSTRENPVTGTGQCGAPIVQQVPGTNQWRVVGIHNGHLLDLDRPELGRGSGVNLSIAVPYLLDQEFDPSFKMPSRTLSVRGFEVGRLAANERVDEIKLIRNGEEVWARSMQKFPHPYSDDHAELAFMGDEVLAGDEIVFTIFLRQQNPPKRSKRTLTFVMP